MYSVCRLASRDFDVVVRSLPSKLTVAAMSALEGCRVRLKGLTKSEYNGLEGTVKESQRAAAEGRLCVALDGNAIPSVAQSASLPWLGEKEPSGRADGLGAGLLLRPCSAGLMTVGAVLQGRRKSSASSSSTQSERK